MRIPRFSSLLLVFAAPFLMTATAPAPLPRLHDGQALTPPMGWNTWNKFGCNVSDTLIRQTADAMVTSGMRDAGYQYLVIDDCWQVARDSSGAIVADSTRFPHGMADLAAYVHSKGLKFGVYTDAGTQTCQGRPGSYNHEEQDARTYASWGVDYVKVDWCHHQGLDAKVQYPRFRDAFEHSGRKIIFSICEWGSNSPWLWAPPVGHLWRTTDDIGDYWESMLRNADWSSNHADVAGPGGWNDPDMLEVGNGGMSAEEYRAHMSLWVIMAAPLIAGNDLRTMTPETKEILTNPEVIAVDQDSLGAQGWMVSQARPGLQVWVKPLKDGSHAILLFNRTGAPARISADLDELGVRGRVRIRDLWAHADRPPVTERYSAMVPSHGVVLVRAKRV